MEITRCETFRKHLKSCPRGSPCAHSLWHGFDVSDNREMYMEERLKCDQARLARSLKKVNQVRLLRGYTHCTGYASRKQFETEEDVPQIKRESVKKGGSSRKGGAAAKKKALVLEKLKMEKQNRVIKLSNVKVIYPEVEKVGTEGTLETHVNGFLFTSYDSSFHVHCLFKDIKASFFQLANGSSPPLLHFHVVEAKITKDILVHLLMTVPGSDKVDKAKHNEYEDRNRDLEIFISEVADKWRCTKEFASLGPFQVFTEKDVFHGYLSSMETAVFTLTYFSIRVYVAAALPTSPFIVVDVEDIEIVNLAVLGHEMINMTVVPQNFESVFEFRFPSGSLSSVKDWLYRGGVKYYVNNKVENWKSLVQDIAENFKNFLELGGWDQYGLEDDATIQDYYSMSSEAESESESDASDTEWGGGCSESDSEEDE